MFKLLKPSVKTLLADPTEVSGTVDISICRWWVAAGGGVRWRPQLPAWPHSHGYRTPPSLTRLLPSRPAPHPRPLLHYLGCTHLQLLNNPSPSPFILQWKYCTLCPSVHSGSVLPKTCDKNAYNWLCRNTISLKVRYLFSRKNYAPANLLRYKYGIHPVNSDQRQGPGKELPARSVGVRVVPNWLVRRF